jgi:hypothetical protein
MMNLGVLEISSCTLLNVQRVVLNVLDQHQLTAHNVPTTGRFKTENVNPYPHLSSLNNLLWKINLQV